jgi:hypothetical protein
MSTLARLQEEFLGALFDESLPQRGGIEVYRRNVLANWRGALAAAYPVVRRLVGDAFFGEAAAQYARTFPSTSGDLNRYGDCFAQFLRGYPHARALAYLPDVARLEWACHESHHASDAPRLDFAALARVSAVQQSSIRFVLHPSVRLLRSPHPVVAIRAANQPGRDGSPERLEGPDDVLVWREDDVVRVARLERFEWEFLERLAQGALLEEAAAVLSDDEARSFLGAALARYVSTGVVSGFAPPESPA